MQRDFYDELLWSLTNLIESQSQFAEAIDEGHNKEALQLANKILKKTPDFVLVKVRFISQMHNFH
jgi:hypothetical protein